MSLTAHWVTEAFDRTRAILHMQPFDGSHTGDQIRMKFEGMFNTWKIKDQIHLVLRDNTLTVVLHKSLVKLIWETPVISTSTCFLTVSNFRRNCFCNIPSTRCHIPWLHWMEKANKANINYRQGLIVKSDHFIYPGVNMLDTRIIDVPFAFFVGAFLKC